MKWVTREHPKTDRIACPWLIRQFIDPDAEIVYVPRDDVLGYAEREGATSFDAPGATYTHRGPRCSSTSSASTTRPSRSWPGSSTARMCRRMWR